MQYPVKVADTVRMLPSVAAVAPISMAQPMAAEILFIDPSSMSNGSTLQGEREEHHHSNDRAGPILREEAKSV
jgi:hypothetical protein